MNAPLPADAVAVAQLPIAHICASPSNPRKHFADDYLAELADSIKSHGLIQPITVRPNPHHQAGKPIYELVVGECRWRAAKLAGLSQIPAFWRELDDKQVLEIQVIENLQRRDVHPIEEAEGYQQLIALHGYNADSIAAKIGKSRAYVYARMKLTALCHLAREAFYDGKLDASSALLIARIPGESLQKKATKEITCGYDNQPLSYRAAKQHIQNRYTLSLKQATFSAEDAKLLPAAGACITCPKYSANERDLFTDIESLDVCTDPDCFDAKHQARRDQLIANAEKRKIPVVTDTQAAREILHGADYVNLDDEVPDDGQERTYRQILGDKAVVATLVQQPYGKQDLMELGLATALESALKKAGWKPQEDDGQSIAVLSPEQIAAGAADRARREAENVEREAARDRCEALATTENTWRRKLNATVWPLLVNADLDVSRQTEIVIHTLAAAWMRREVDYNGFDEKALETYLNIILPEEYDDAVELEKVLQTMQKTKLGTLLAMMLVDLAEDSHELRAHMLEPDDPLPLPHTLLALATAFNVNAEALRDPKVQPKTAKTKAAKTASPPSNAAHAEDKSATAAPADNAKPVLKPAAKKAKAKADPAPTTSANEAAAPPKPPKLDTWPFPTGARP